MASVINRPNGHRWVQFVNTNGKRNTLRLGKIDRRSAEQISRHIENLLSAKISGQSFSKDTAAWVDGIKGTLRIKLEKTELVSPIEVSASVMLGPFLDEYIAKRTDIKPASLIAIQQAVENLNRFFGTQTVMNTITSGHAEDFKRWLMTKARIQSRKRKGMPGLSLATVAKRLQGSVTIFNDAKKRRLISENPFECVKQPKNTNPERQYYVKAETIEKLIERSPNSEWKLLLAMSRYLGVRVPSEPFSMTWDCVDWERDRLRVPSPKTEVHGKKHRMVPILPVVLSHLKKVHSESRVGSQFIFESLRERGSIQQAERGFWSGINLREPLRRMIVKMGKTPWPRLWHNLRASAQTDLADKFPIHVVCEWLGNSRIVAQNHYLQTTDEHFELATGKAKQKPKQQPQEITGIERKTEMVSEGKTADLQHISQHFHLMGKQLMGDEGFEPPTSSV